MAKYRVLEKSFINHRVCEEGEIVEYDGEPGANLQLVAATGADDVAATGKNPAATGKNSKTA